MHREVHKNKPIGEMSDGDVREASLEDLIVGAVMREFTRMGTAPQFADAVIVKVDSHEATVTIHRVHAIVSKLTGGFYTTHEVVKLDLDKLVGPASMWRLVCMATGLGANVAR